MCHFGDILDSTASFLKFARTWHVVDLVSIALVFVYTILVFIGDLDDNNLFIVRNTGKGNVTLAVITTLFLTARFVSLLRGFDRTGWLVAVLMQNFLDVRGFIVVIVSILFGFTIAFRILFAKKCMVELDDQNVVNNQCEEDPFGNLGRSLLSTFELTIMGSYEPSLMYSSSDVLLAVIVFAIAVTVVMVVALNALIAVLGDSFSRVQENVTANRRRERAELIVEYLSMMPTWQRKRIEQSNQYFHALLASDGHGDLLVHKDDWQGGLNALKKELTELTINNNERTQLAIQELRVELKEEVSIMIRNEIGAVLNEIFMEVKEISKVQRSSGGGQVRTSKKVMNSLQQMQRNFTAAPPPKSFSTPFDGIRKTLPNLSVLIGQDGNNNNQRNEGNNPNSTSTEQNDMQTIELTNNDDDTNAEDFPIIPTSHTFG